MTDKEKIKSAINILCEGRTFYSGYFDNYEELSRIDKALFILIYGKSKEKYQN